MGEIFLSERPQSDFLRKHIAYYYFHQLGKDHPVCSFIYYPHYQNALTIYKDSALFAAEQYVTISKPQRVGYTFGFSKLINHAARAIIHPPFHKIGIVFRPLGFNHFLRGDLSEYITQPVNVYFNWFKDSMKETLDLLYASQHIQEKVQLLDHYFLSMYQGFNAPKMEKAMEYIFHDASPYQVEELAHKIDVSRKTLLRLFKKHHNCSVIDYLKMVQFRRSVESFQKSQDKASLTALAHDTFYYDQSEFINHFKKLTGYSPKRFFKNLSNLDGQDTYWTFS